MRYFNFFMGFVLLLASSITFSRNIDTRTFSSDSFVVELPANWLIQNYNNKTILSSPENDKAVYIMIVGIPHGKSSPINEELFKNTKLETTQNEFSIIQNTGYKIHDAYSTDKLRIVDFAIQNQEIMVNLSFGDYNCLSKNCSDDIVQLMRDTFKVKNKNSLEVSIKDIKNMQENNSQ